MSERKTGLSRRQRLLEDLGKTRVAAWLGQHIANPVDRRLLEWSDGRIGGTFAAQNVGLLYNTGAKSGEPRKTPLIYYADDERFIVVASNGGAPRHPAWFHNVSAHPDVEFLPRGGPRALYRARRLEGAERDAAWAKVSDFYAGYDVYQGRAGREIPVVALEPRS